jgi:hypothetical protein
MTVIAVKDGVMAADSHVFSGGTRHILPPGQSKIWRSVRYGIVGTCGDSVDGQAIRRWVADGMDFSNPPQLRNKIDDDESVCWLWLKPDGTCWRYGADMLGYEVSTPTALGYESACIMSETAMACGLTAVQAVELTISRCVWVGGDVHSESIR